MYIYIYIYIYVGIYMNVCIYVYIYIYIYIYIIFLFWIRFFFALLLFFVFPCYLKRSEDRFVYIYINKKNISKKENYMTFLMNTSLLIFLEHY